MNKLIEGKKYIIYWEDTFSFTGWWNEEEIKERADLMNYYMETVGFYCGEYKPFLAFAQQYNNSVFVNMAKWGHITWIPKGCIKKIKRITI